MSHGWLRHRAACIQKLNVSSGAPPSTSRNLRSGTRHFSSFITSVIRAASRFVSESLLNASSSQNLRNVSFRAEALAFSLCAVRSRPSWTARSRRFSFTACCVDPVRSASSWMSFSTLEFFCFFVSSSSAFSAAFPRAQLHLVRHDASSSTTTRLSSARSLSTFFSAPASRFAAMSRCSALRILHW